MLIMNLRGVYNNYVCITIFNRKAGFTFTVFEQVKHIELRNE